MEIKIESILGGFSPMNNVAGSDQYVDGIGIDAEAIDSIGSLSNKAKGGMMPGGEETIITTSTLGETPIWATGSRGTTGVFVYGSAGSVYTLTATSLDLAGDGSQWNTGGTGNGMVTYGDYVYLATGTDISRLGPLSATAPRLEPNFWTSSIGMGQAALVNTAYPSNGFLSYPNHVMHAHNDGSVYIADCDSGQGMIHSFRITSAGATSAAYADTNPLGGGIVLPPGLIPTDIKSYGTDLAILCSPAGIYGPAFTRVGNSALVLWDTISEKFYRNIPINEGVASALVNKNGELYVLAGTGNIKLLKYLGGESFQTLSAINFSARAVNSLVYPPLASATEVIGDAIFFGGNRGIYTWGYRSGQLPPALHQPIRIGGSAVGFIKNLVDSPYPIFSWRDTATYAISRRASAGTLTEARWTSQVYNIGKPFRIKRIKIPLSGAVASGTFIEVVVYSDGGISGLGTITLPAIDNTNFSDKRLIDFNNLSIQCFTNFFMELIFYTSRGVLFPITIEYETDY